MGNKLPAVCFPSVGWREGGTYPLLILLQFVALDFET